MTYTLNEIHDLLIRLRDWNDKLTDLNYELISILDDMDYSSLKQPFRTLNHAYSLYFDDVVLGHFTPELQCKIDMSTATSENINTLIERVKELKRREKRLSKRQEKRRHK